MLQPREACWLAAEAKCGVCANAPLAACWQLDAKAQIPLWLLLVSVLGFDYLPPTRESGGATQVK